MAAAEVASRPQQDRPSKRKPFTAWVKRLTNRGDQSGGSKKGGSVLTPKQKKKQAGKNNPYPESSYARRPSQHSSADGRYSYANQNPNYDDGSVLSVPTHEREGAGNSNRSTAPTVATNPETVHSDAGYSKAFTSTTAGGALSSVDGAGEGSMFSSPNHSERSLTTTLTTMHSTAAGNMLHHQGTSGALSQHQHTGPSDVFSHQYPVSPAPSAMNTTASAIPRHLTDGLSNSGNILTDDASILTLASSSKRRRRSMDTDASMRALAPNSVFGGSRESLPLSVLSGNADTNASITGTYAASLSRPSGPGGLASAERASVYSSQGISAPVLASERNSVYSHAAPRKDISDAKSMRSITGLDARSQYDGKSINNDGKNVDVNSLRNYEGSVGSGRLGHGRTDSIGAPLASPGLRNPSTSGALSRRSSDWRGLGDHEEDEADNEERGRTESIPKDDEDSQKH